MKYTKRQKEAINDLDKLMFLLDDVYSTGLVEDEERDKYVKSIFLILDLLDSQQKEIQKLKNKNKKYYDGKLFTANQLKVIEKNQNKYFIHKNKIKEKIKQLENEYVTVKVRDEKIFEGICNNVSKIDVLNELLRGD